MADADPQWNNGLSPPQGEHWPLEYPPLWQDLYEGRTP
jgi:hypothetical protein